ncbi:hypothetical protein FH966_05475 [Lentibacillus cibarius]|uniref:DUF2508 family protein n=1 Tax=Lentibacillus cibarius TaxID=2583219 RepID=A0A549YH58_9BACI|nr:AidA/PixA family protein [Lentibacillus cibarius]TMN22423.1 hypothetical protein FFL34_10015 [Lentibacillus cibarius]TRM11214.1 hypothetical protein FH966_05475 [Lentibacillus cibarius]
MLGFLINDEEQKEMEYLIKRELEELLMDMQDSRIEAMVKETMKERYQTMFNLYRRVASKQEYIKYIPKHTGNQ